MRSSPGLTSDTLTEPETIWVWDTRMPIQRGHERPCCDGPVMHWMGESKGEGIMQSRGRRDHAKNCH